MAKKPQQGELSPETQPDFNATTEHDFFRLRRVKGAAGWEMEQVRVEGDRVAYRGPAGVWSTYESVERQLITRATEAERTK